MKIDMLIKYGLLLFTAITFSSCEEIIDINLKNAEPALVVEANISDVNELQYIYLSKTVQFGADNVPFRVSGARVSVKENNSLIYNFTEFVPGVYRTNFKGKVGATYQLEIELEGEIYNATSVMPPKVNLDSVSITQVDFFDEKRKFVKVHYQDPNETADAYRFVLSINNQRLSEFFVDNDRFNNGNYIDRTIYSDDPEIVTGDEIALDFQTIDLNNYRYFFTIQQISGGGGPPVAPSNPVSNISNGALGYFSAHTSQRRTFKVNN
jgi:hypothetical protein